MKKIVFAAGVAIAASVWGFSFDDIHYWVGEGTNKIGIAIDWGGTAKAWGYRWNGTAPKLGDAIRAIVREDYRLKMGESGGYIVFFGYDVADSAAQFDVGAGTSSDISALAAIQRTIYMPDHPYAWEGYVYQYWNALRNAGTSYSTSSYSYTALADNETLQGNTWYSFAYGIEVDLHVPTAAETPYGFSVVGCHTSAQKNLYTENDPNVVLGRPTDTAYDEWAGGTFVVSPACPAFGEGTVLTLEDLDGGAYVTIAFDHDVVDDPANPFGVDFIVFGNAGLPSDAGMFYNNTDPASAKCVTSQYSFDDPGVVEVSQDGITWRKCNGYADTSAMPTLARVYAPANPDTSVYEGNAFWGEPTNPCFPVDPAITMEDCLGLTFAEICRRYNGSAGGRGFDISALDLPVNAKGRKWFRYVRIASAELENEDGDTLPSTPEVDAVADVAPVSGYRNWVLDNFTWDKAWQTNLTDAAAIAQNGLPNGINCVYGLGPNDPVATDVPFKVASFEPGETEHIIKMRSPAELTARPKGLVVRETDSLGVGWKSVMPTLMSSESQGDGTWLNTFTVPKGNAMFFKLALDTE